VFAEFERLDALMSVWRPGSDIVRLNAAAGDHPVPVSAETVEALRAARQVSEWTGGKFDVTFGALSDLWRFDQDQDNRIPDRAEVRRRLPRIDYRNLVVDERAGTAFLRRRGMRAHLGGIGKGDAVARAAAILRSRGVGDFMIQSGGDLYVGGTKDGQPWRLGIADPRAAEHAAFATIDLSNATLSTSGDYERFFIANGRRYHHIIDPATGEPSTAGCRSVSVVSGDPTMADGLSTGIFLLGPRDGMALADRLHVGVVIVTDRNEVLVSADLRPRVRVIATPKDAI
jgi:thiamine biosynthesis lipoprotein